jgi:hypothetical protein
MDTSMMMSPVLNLWGSSVLLDAGIELHPTYNGRDTTLALASSLRVLLLRSSKFEARSSIIIDLIVSFVSFHLFDFVHSMFCSQKS